MCAEKPSINDILPDPNGPHDLLIPRCRGYRMREPMLFVDEPMSKDTAGVSDWMFQVSGVPGSDPGDLHAKTLRLGKAAESECRSRD